MIGRLAYRLASLAGGLASAVAVAGVPASHARADQVPAIGDRELALRVVDQDFGIGAGESFTASIELTGPADDVTAVTERLVAAEQAGDDEPLNEVRVTAHEPITRAGDIADIDSVGPGDPVDSVSVAATDAFGTGEANAGELTVPVTLGASDGGPATIDVTVAGIHPLTIDVVIGGDVVASAVTFVDVIDPGSTVTLPLAIAIVAGVADPGPWPSPTELSSASIEVAKLVELSEAVDGPLSISLPPGLVTALSTQPDGAEPTGATVVDETTPEDEQSTETTVLAGAPGATEPALAGVDSPDALTGAFRADELFSVPALALDPSSLVALDQHAFFTAQLRDGEDVLSSASPRAVVSRAVWLSRGPVSAEAMVVLRDLGIRMLVVPTETASALGVPTDDSASGLFDVSLAADGSLPAMTFNGLGARLQTPLPGDNMPTANERAVRLLVELQLQRRATGIPAVLLATPRVTVPDPAVTAQFVNLVSGMPDVSVVPISRLPGIVDGALANGPTTPVVLPPVAGDDLSARLARVAIARINGARAARMLVDPDRSTEWSADLDRAMSSAIDDATASERLDATEAEIRRVLTAIVPPDADTFRLTGTSSTLRLVLANTYDQPLRVMIHVRSPKLRFREPDPEVEVPAGGSARVDVPVEARSNGTFTIEVDVLAPDRAPLGQPVILKARVSRITGLSQVVTGAAVIVLVSWWYSHLRRSRRRRLAVADGYAMDRSGDEPATVSPDAAEALVSPTPTREPASDAAAESGPGVDPG